MTSKTFIKNIFLFTALLLASCNHENKMKKGIDISKNTNQKIELSSHNNDTLVVNETCAVFISADSIQIDKMKKELGEDFYIGADDYLFYLNETREYLKNKKLKIVNCDNKKFLKFIYSDQKQELIDLSNLNQLGMVYFFDPKRKSKVIDMTMTNEEYKEYFE